MKIPRIDMTSVAAFPKGGRCINDIRSKAGQVVPDDGIPKGNGTPVMVRSNEPDIAAAAGDNTMEARVPAPESPAGQPTNILSCQVE